MAKVYFKNKAFIGTDGRSQATKIIKATAPGLKKSQYSAITKALRKHAGGGVTGSEVAKALSEVAGQGVIRRTQALKVKNKLGVGSKMGYSGKSDTQPETRKAIQSERPKEKSQPSRPQVSNSGASSSASRIEASRGIIDSRNGVRKITDNSNSIALSKICVTPPEIKERDNFE